MTILDVEAQFTQLSRGDDNGFHQLANAVAAFQFEKNEIFNRFCSSLGASPAECYLPIGAFKAAPVASFDVGKSEAVFESSGTAGSSRSKHYVKSLDVYRRSSRTTFSAVFGAKRRTILAHLPGYIESGSKSSLVSMVTDLVNEFGSDRSGLFLKDTSILDKACSLGNPIILFGAAFGLLALGESRSWKLPEDSVIIETGGMKTHRRELSRHSLHTLLADSFGIPDSAIWSEYGMAELLSQAYRKPGGSFQFPPWVRWQLFDPENPRKTVAPGSPGLLAVRDLANMYSVSNILTEDVAVERDGGVEILGRLAGADLRGCNLLLEAYL